MKVTITLTEEMLGTKAANKEVFAAFIASKHPSGTPQKDELENAENREEAGTTVFHWMKRKDIAATNPALSPGDPDELIPGIYNYQIKGMFKSAAGFTNRFDKEFREDLEKLPAHKARIDGCIFVSPRFIPIILPPGATMGLCERPLRAETAQGPRVSLVRSETVPIGSTLTFDVNIFESALILYVTLWLNYGRWNGCGQWRNSGKGTFSWNGIKSPAEEKAEVKAKAKVKAEAEAEAESETEGEGKDKTKAKAKAKADPKVEGGGKP